MFCELLHNAFCNGLYYFSCYGLEIDYKDEDYAKAKNEIKVIKKQNGDLSEVCYEDVYLKMLEMKLPLNVIDTENGVDNVMLDLDTMYDNLQFVPLRTIANMKDETDDAEDCDTFLQCVIYKEIVFA
jgi:DNA helicase IV